MRPWKWGWLKLDNMETEAFRITTRVDSDRLWLDQKLAIEVMGDGIPRLMTNRDSLTNSADTRLSRFLGSGQITDNTEATHMDRLLCGWQHECWLYPLLAQLLRLTRECTQQGHGRQCGRRTIMIVVCYIE
jgi:hypothetical protein